MRALEETGIIDAPEPAASAPSAAASTPASTINANDDHHLPARRCGSNRRLDRSGKDDPRKAGLLAPRLLGSGPNERRHVISNERDMPCRLAVEDMARGA